MAENKINHNDLIKFYRAAKRAQALEPARRFVMLTEEQIQDIERFSDTLELKEKPCKTKPKP